MAGLTRAEYAAMSRDELHRRLAAARDRETRADTAEAALADAFAIQELEAALAAPTDPVRLTGVPPRFIQDCQECDVDAGDYSPTSRLLVIDRAALADIVDRAEHYAGDSLDAAPPGLKVAARAFLKAVRRQVTR